MFYPRFSYFFIFSSIILLALGGKFNFFHFKWACVYFFIDFYITFAVFLASFGLFWFDFRDCRCLDHFSVVFVLKLLLWLRLIISFDVLPYSVFIWTVNCCLFLFGFFDVATFSVLWFPGLFSSASFGVKF